MPPKKTAAAAQAKVGKRKVEKDNVEEEVKPDVEVPEKRTRGRAASKKAEESEKPKAKPKKEKVEEKKEKPARRGKAAKEEADIEDEDVADKPQKAGTSTSKKENTNGEVNAKKGKGSGKSEAAKPKKAVQKSEEDVKKPAASRAKRAKKVDSDEEKHDAEEEPEEEEQEENGETDAKPSGVKKNVKRKAPKAREEPKDKARNPTSTNWETIEFNSTTKNSNKKPPNFHITSWNVDGLRAWIKKGGLDILKHDKPDIFCVQETKCDKAKLPEEVLEIDGYESLWCDSDKQGYAGVGILTKIKPLSVVYGINSEEHDTEGRCITAEYEQFYLVNVYVPNSGRKLVTLPKRLEWNKLFKEFIKKLDAKKPVIVCGDLNVAHAPIDLANPKSNTKNAGFTAEEREGMTEFLEDGFVDTFRQLYPDKEKAYTFWTYMSNSRAKNTGWRLDYFLVSERFVENVCDNVIHSDVMGSDHCPLALFMNV